MCIYGINIESPRFWGKKISQHFPTPSQGGWVMEMYKIGNQDSSHQYE